ncbi:hypothetical protein [Desulfopila sp. IMCC35008]|uniref:hypothetical protein n=1 Tax=Desulfopila sp. IMCC35008 TaxID=2653858 RepID=UPI0013D42104|nr:hypothetical protein [Desulfopila sp. IMCC35008]
MQIIFYKSSLCPRCRRAGHHLSELLNEYSDHELEIVDILNNPLRSWQDGIRMIPAITAGNRKLSGLYLTRQNISDFLAQTKQPSSDNNKS